MNYKTNNGPDDATDKNNDLDNDHNNGQSNNSNDPTYTDNVGYKNSH